MFPYCVVNVSASAPPEKKREEKPGAIRRNIFCSESCHLRGDFAHVSLPWSPPLDRPLVYLPVGGRKQPVPNSPIDRGRNDVSLLVLCTRRRDGSSSTSRTGGACGNHVSALCPSPESSGLWRWSTKSLSRHELICRPEFLQSAATFLKEAGLKVEEGTVWINLPVTVMRK